MVFSSSIFLAWFLPLFLFLYLLADTRYKNMVILAASLIFYAWGAPKFIFLVLATTFLDFHLVRWMDASPTPRRRQQLLIASISLNLGLLAIFKYANFMVDNVNAILSGAALGPIPWVQIALPIGISFFIFESLTYVIDVYRGVHKPLTRFRDYLMYILLFPKLIAGPIVRYHELADQIHSRTHSADRALTGFYQFCLGLAKKVLIANTMGAGANVFLTANALQLSSIEAWIGLVAFSLQLYYDFSGYSDMAIGLARILGFKLPDNFNSPFTAGSITEFWRRWHITLGNWMRNYLYIPLGGSKVDETRVVYRNLIIVFLASGLWHGASWNYIIWGAYHGIWLVIERIFLLKYLKRMPKPLGMAYTGIITVFGFGIFWLEDLGHAARYYGSLFSGGPGIGLNLHIDFWWIGGIAIFFSWFAAIPGASRIQERIYAETQPLKWHIPFLAVSMALFLLCLAIVSWSPYNPFLYFRF